MANPKIHARVSESLKQQVEEYQEEVGATSQSEAARQLIAKGIEYEETPTHQYSWQDDLLHAASGSTLALSFITFLTWILTLIVPLPNVHTLTGLLTIGLGLTAAGLNYATLHAREKGWI